MFILKKVLTNESWICNNINSSCKILDFGCGNGSLVHSLLKSGHDAYGCDIRQSLYSEIIHPELIAPRVRLSTDNHLPFKNNTFDYCVSNQVFELC